MPPNDEITARQLAERMRISPARLFQLVEEDRIRPAPRRIQQGERNFMYLFAPHARRIGSDKKPGRPKKITTAVK